MNNKHKNKQKELISELCLKKRYKYWQNKTKNAHYVDFFDEFGRVKLSLNKIGFGSLANDSLYMADLYEYDRFNNVVKHLNVERVNWISKDNYKHEVINDKLFMIKKSYSAKYNEDNILYFSESFTGIKNSKREIEKYEILTNGNERHIIKHKANRIVQILDDRKRVIESYYYKSYNNWFKKLMSKQINKYDKEDNLIENICLDRNNEVTFHEKYEYFEGKRVKIFDFVTRRYILFPDFKNGSLFKLTRQGLNPYYSCATIIS
jgi:hypothetical protein